MEKLDKDSKPKINKTMTQHISNNKKKVNFPNIFNLGKAEIENVTKMRNSIASKLVDYSAAELMTCHISFICVYFEIMHREAGHSKADLVFVARKIQTALENFINEL